MTPYNHIIRTTSSRHSLQKPSAQLLSVARAATRTHAMSIHLHFVSLAPTLLGS